YGTAHTHSYTLSLHDALPISTTTDRFTTALTKEQIIEMTQGEVDSTPVVDPITGETQITVTRTEFNPDIVSKYRLKEDYVFDRKDRKSTRLNSSHVKISYAVF